MEYICEIDDRVVYTGQFSGPSTGTESKITYYAKQNATASFIFLQIV